MRRFLISIIILVCGVNCISAQTLLDSIVEVKNLINDDKDDEAESILNKIENQCMHSENDTLRVLFLESKGIILWDREEYKDCIPYFQSVIDLYDKLHLKYQNYLDAFVAIGYSYGRLHDYDNAERFYRKALLKSVAADFNKEFRPNVYKNLGNLYMEKGYSLLAQECFKRASVEDVDDFDFMSHNYIEWKTKYWTEIGTLLEAKKYPEAADKCAEMIQGIEKKEGKSETYILEVYTYANILSRYLNKYDEAKPFYEEIIEWGKNKSDKNENVCGAYCNLALYYAVNGDFPHADSIIDEGVPYLAKANNEYYPLHSIYRYVGNGAYWKKNYVMAIKYYEQYLKPQYSREQGTNYEDVVNQLSVSYILSDNPVKAKSLLSSFLKTDETRLKTDNVSVLSNIYHNLGRATMLSGSKSEALKLLNKSKELQMGIYGEVSERTLQYIKECSSK